MKMLPNARPWLGFRLPLALVSVAIAAPAQAATFAQSTTQSLLSNFRVNGYEVVPIATNSDTNTEAIVTGNLSTVVLADSDADAFFEEQPPLLGTLAEGFSQGIGTLPYLGQSLAEAEALGSFEVSGLFEFDLNAVLDLSTGIERPQDERALAGGDIQLSLFQETKAGALLIDTFSLTGLSVSHSDEDLFAVDYSSGFDFSFDTSGCGLASTDCAESSFGGAEEFAYASLSGLYQREFENPTVLTLVHSQLSLTEVEEVPETGNVAALLLLGMGGLILRRRGLMLKERC